MKKADDKREGNQPREIDNMVDQYVLKVNIPLSNRAFFIRVTDPSQSLDSIIESGVAELRQQGRMEEAAQLEYLWRTHQIRPKMEKENR